MIFQYQYKRLGQLISVDHYAGSNPQALDYCGTTVYPEMAWLSFVGNLDDLELVEFVDLDQEEQVSKESDKAKALAEAERIRKETLAAAEREDRKARAREESERVERARREWEGP